MSHYKEIEGKLYQCKTLFDRSSLDFSEIAAAIEAAKLLKDPTVVIQEDYGDTLALIIYGWELGEAK